MIVREACELWIAYRAQCSNLGLVAESTYDNQSAIVGTIVVALGAHALDALRKSDIDLWVGERLQTHAPVTVRGELNVLRQVLNWCVDEQHLGQRPRLPTVQVPATENALPSEAAFVWALKAVPDNHRAALELMMLTGLSPHEAERLQVRDKTRQTQSASVSARTSRSRRRAVAAGSRLTRALANFGSR
jgi:site-specific recombinase XerD